MSQPPWEVLNLIATYLDPKTLAIASSVSKSWFSSMSSDHIWKPILATQFPSLFSLSSPAVSSRILFSMGRAANTRRLRGPSKPTLSLADLVFTVSISTQDANVVSITIPCDGLRLEAPGVFRFGLGCHGVVLREGMEEMRVTWNVVLKGWRGVFTMMEHEGKLGWFSKELPAPECCSGAVTSAVAADLKVEVCEGEEENGVRVEEVSVGILSVLDWRYISVEDGLRYLQHFLPANDADNISRE